MSEEIDIGFFVIMNIILLAFLTLAIFDKITGFDYVWLILSALFSFVNTLEIHAIEGISTFTAIILVLIYLVYGLGVIILSISRMSEHIN